MIVWLRCFWYFIKMYFIGFYSLFRQLMSDHIKPKDLPLQHGRVAIVTGGSDGIGFEVCKSLAKHGMHVIIGSLNLKEAEDAIDAIQKDCPTAKVQCLRLDLRSCDSVRHFAEEFLAMNLPLHVLVNNAGVMMVPYKETQEGLEYHISINFVGHFLLTQILLPKLEESGSDISYTRIINVTSSTHFIGKIHHQNFFRSHPSCYSSHAAYAQSKLAIVLSTYEQHHRLQMKDSKVTVNCLHPGVVNTKLYKELVWLSSWLVAVLKLFFKMSRRQVVVTMTTVAENHPAGSPTPENFRKLCGLKPVSFLDYVNDRWC